MRVLLQQESCREVESSKIFVKMDESGYIIAGEDGVTSTPGILAAGDIRTKNLRQVVTAVADGANAVASGSALFDGVLKRK